MTDTWLVLGGSSAIARAFARVAANDGADLLLAGRDRDDLDLTAADLRIRTQRRVEVIDFDAADFAGHAATIARARETGSPARTALSTVVVTKVSQQALTAPPTGAGSDSSRSRPMTSVGVP